ncbi:substrate transporter [Paramyrothecium foliicola]|nr:substrate transporter [Paramyrothecium foliicola]
MDKIQKFQLGDWELQSGGTLPGAWLAYKTFGDPSLPAVLYPTWFSGAISDNEWLIGEDKTLNPANYFIIIVALIGNGQSISPSNSNIMPFPDVSFYDNVRAQRRLVQNLDVKHLRAVLGWSMGAAQTFQWATQYPDIMDICVPFCGSAKTSQHNQVFLEGVKSALLAAKKTSSRGSGAGRNEVSGSVDRTWSEEEKTVGLKAFGRGYAGWGFSQAFYRHELYKKSYGARDLEAFMVDFWEGWALSKEPENLLTMLHTWQSGDVSKQEPYNGDFEMAMAAVKARTLVLPSQTDLYFPPEDSEYEVACMDPKVASLDVFPSIWGHWAGGPPGNMEDVEWLDKRLATVFKEAPKRQPASNSKLGSLDQRLALPRPHSVRETFNALKKRPELTFCIFCQIATSIRMARKSQESARLSGDAGIKSIADATHLEEDLKHEHGVVLKSSLDGLGLLATAKKFWKAVIVCNLLCIAAACDGYQVVLNGNVIANRGFIRQFGFPNDQGVNTLNANYTALWGAMQSLGQFIGMVGLTPVSDRIGRKMTLYIAWIIIGGSLAIETIADDWKEWAGAKILAGVGIGCIQATLPVYVTEWAPVNIRGAMLFSYGFWNRIGSFLAPLVLTVSEKRDPFNFRVPILTQWGFLAVMLPIFLWIPETPAYYASCDQHEKGKASLRRINGKIEGYNVETEYAIINNTIMEERREQQGTANQGIKEVLQSYAQCFHRQNARRTLGAALPVCAQQLTGLAFLNGYASLFFRQSGFDDAFLITTIMTVIALVTSVSLITLTDKFGRRIVVVVSSIVCTLTMLIVGILGFVPKTTPLKNFLIFDACVWSFFNVALGSLGWAFVGEVASQNLRVRTAGIAAGASVIFGLTFNTTVPLMLDVNGVNWGYSTAFLFLGTGLFTCVLVYFYVPEPSQRNPAEMDEMYDKGVPARRMRKYVTEVQKGRVEEPL